MERNRPVDKFEKSITAGGNPLPIQVSTDQVNVDKLQVNGDMQIKGLASGIKLKDNLDANGKNLMDVGNISTDSITMGEKASAIYDEDDMASNSSNGLSTQQSIKAYVDTHQKHSLQVNFKFEQESAGRTFFRDINAQYDDHDWYESDTEDSTTVGDTASIILYPSISGLIVPFNCKLKGARWVGYSSQNFDNVVHLQTWTGTSVPDNSYGTITATLRETNELTNYKVKHFNQYSALDVSMTSGQMIYPAFQYESGTRIGYYGSVVYLLERA